MNDKVNPLNYFQKECIALRKENNMSDRESKRVKEI